MNTNMHLTNQVTGSIWGDLRMKCLVAFFSIPLSFTFTNVTRIKMRFFFFNLVGGFVRKLKM